MKQQARIYYKESQMAQMRDRWQKGESLNVIARIRICNSGFHANEEGCPFTLIQGISQQTWSCLIQLFLKSKIMQMQQRRTVQ